MEFLTVTKAGVTLELEIDTENARETTPEYIGSVARAFNGGIRSDREEFRGWSFLVVNLPNATYEQLRTMIKNDAVCSYAGGALSGVGPVSCVADVGEAPYIDDGRESLGYSRTFLLTIRQAA